MKKEADTGNCTEQISYLRECLHSNRQIEYSDIEVVPYKESVISIEDLKYLQFAQPTCQEKLKPFVCLYLFNLMVPGEKPIGPSPMACKKIRDESCAFEWKLVTKIKELPKCEMLDASMDLLELCSGI